MRCLMAFLALLFSLSISAMPADAQRCGAGNPSGCPNPIYSGLGIGIASPPVGSGAITQSVTATTPITANNGALFGSLLNSNYQSSTTVIQRIFDPSVNDNGDSSGNGTQVWNVVGRFTANANSIDNNSGNSTPNAAWDFGIDVPCLKNNPPGGLPVGASLKNCYANWSPSSDNSNNEYSSMDGIFANGEWDLSVNGLDDWNNRPMNQYFANNAKPVTGGAGWPASVTSMFYIAANGDLYTGDFIQFPGNFSNAVLDLEQSASGTPTITSATPSGPVRSITVDNILPLTAGNFIFLGLGFNGDTAAKTKTVVASGGSSVTLNNAYYIRTDMLVYDLTNPSSIPVNAYVTSISGSVITLSTGTAGNGDILLFAFAQKEVLMNGDSYEIAGVIPLAAGSDAGTVYFTSAVTVADATQGVTLAPNAHEIWLADGKSWDNIAFNTHGSTTIGGDGSSGLSFSAPPLAGNFTFNGAGVIIQGQAGGWSTNRIGKQLIIEPILPNTSNPAIGFTDATMNNPWSISDNAGIFLFAAMPALNDSTDPPIYHLALNQAGDDYIGQFQTVLTPSATTGFTHPFMVISGTPSGNPTFNSGWSPACVINQSQGFLDCYYSAAWHKIAFSSGAG